MHSQKHVWLQRTFLHLVAAGLGIVIAILSYILFKRLFYESFGPLTADSTLYMAVGRGILNGLVPYRDLFETKPPGIFLIVAISYALGSNMVFARLIQIMSLLIIVGGGCFISIRLLPTKVEKEWRVMACLLAIIGSILLSFYTAERSGEFQVESIGAALCIAYLSIIVSAKNQRRLNDLQMSLASVALLGAIGMKEPFVLVALASICVLLPYLKSGFVQNFAIPLLFAIGVGLAISAAIYILEPYVTIYLPEMLSKHIMDGSPLIEEFLTLQRIFTDLEGFARFFGVFVGAILVYAFTRQVCAVPLRKKFFTLGVAVISIILTLFAISLGGTYWNHHFVFAVPYYCVIFAIALHFLVQEKPYIFQISLSCITIIIAFLVCNLPNNNYFVHLQNVRRDQELAQSDARAIDAILEACNLHSYQFLGANGIYVYAYTKYSPAGPNFFQYPYLVDRNRPFFRWSFLTNVATQDIVVLQSYDIGDLEDHVRSYIQKHFTEEPWTCAVGLNLPTSTQLLFRKSP